MSLLEGYMPHARNRLALPLLKKKLKFARIVSIQGPRQCGKSYFARELYSKKSPQSHYVTLDSKNQAEAANSRPSSFIEEHLPAHPLIIDEAQKAPALFDELKYRVDLKPAPGQFLILGSTEFSKEIKVRESLTGRLSRLRLFTFTLREAQSLSQNETVKRQHLMQHLTRGGFPGIFAVRDAAEREQLFDEWLKVTVERDLQQFPKVKLDSELALNILREIALSEEPTSIRIASRLKKPRRTISTYIHYLSILFALHRLAPSALGTGKYRYYLCDVSLVHFFGGSFERQLETWMLYEFLAQMSY
jgi:predicted AAA+ superfamily ATPase